MPKKHISPLRIKARKSAIDSVDDQVSNFARQDTTTVSNSVKHDESIPTSPNVVLHQDNRIPVELNLVSEENLKKVREYVESQRRKNIKVDLRGLISHSAKHVITCKLRLTMSEGEVEALFDDPDEFFRVLLTIYVKVNTTTGERTLADIIRANLVIPKFLGSLDQFNYFELVINKLFELPGFREKVCKFKEDPVWEQEIVEILKKILPEPSKPSTLRRKLESRVTKTCKVWSLFEDALLKSLLEEESFLTECIARQITPTQNPSVDKSVKMKNPDSIQDADVSNKKRKLQNSSSSDSSVQKKGKPEVLCSFCGRHHKSEKCLLQAHPDANKGAGKWIDSMPGKKWREKVQNLSVLPWDMTLSGQPWDAPEKPSAKSAGELIFSALHKNHTDLIPFILQTNTNVRVNVLLDSGAFNSNYVSRTLVEELGIAVNASCSCKDGTCLSNNLICSGFSGLCGKSSGTSSLMITFFDEHTRALHMPIAITARVIDSPFHLILGKSTILKNNLFSKLKVQFECTDVFHADLDRIFAERDYAFAHISTDISQITLPEVEHLLATTLDKNILLGEPEETESEVDEVDFEEISYEDPLPTQPIPTLIEGPESLRKAISALCLKYIDIFSTTVVPEPAKLEPLALLVDTVRWHSSRNRGGVRPQTLAAQREIKSQIDSLLKLKVIRKSEAIYYSQVLLTPKPNGNWRMCVDYKNLNDATKQDGMSWPLPNIEQMLRRIGEHRPKYFGVMDMTSGYHQIEMAESCRMLTAFICYLGVFEFNRIPFGLKSAPAYFQKLMATVVLAGLLYTICELYLDDCIVFGRTEDEFLNRLEQVFIRFRQYNIKLNPDKCKLGLCQVEYVGHLIDSNGLSFTKGRLEMAVSMNKPQTQKSLKMFIGTANYFHRHIRNLSSMIKPLEELLKDYRKNSTKPVAWNPRADKAFDDVVHAIRHCPKLHFVDEAAPIFLHTDASDYGIGAYLFQLVDGVEQPVAFLSKALSGSQLKWSTYDKEAYAIYYAINKLQHFIRDVKFTVRTDHKNLTHIGEGGSPKVARWREFLLPYNFNVEHIPGNHNVAADGFSRLCIFDEYDQDHPREYACNSSESYRLLASTFSRSCAPLSLNAMTNEELDDPVFVIPMRERVWIKSVHNDHAGHFGIDMTYKRLTDRGRAHPKLRDFVRCYIRRCPTCQKLSQIKEQIVTNKFVTSSSFPMQRLSVDTIGPIPQSIDGYKYLLVFIDTFSRYVTIWPTRTLEAVEAADMLIKHVGVFGCPDELLSDNGSQFANSVITELLERLNIEQKSTIAHSKEENAIVERANKEVMRHLRAFVLDSAIIESWTSYVPFVQRIINSKVSLTTGIAPCQIITPAINLDNQIIPDSSNNFPIAPNASISEYLKAMRQFQKTAIEIASKYLDAHAANHLSNQPDSPTIFPVDSFVLVEYPNTAMGKKPPHKLAPNLRGPYRVAKIIGNEYQLIDLVSNKIKENVHVKRLRPYRFGTNDQITPRDIANKEQESFDVEVVLRHSGTFAKKKSLKFLVKWLGYDDSHNSWVSYQRLKSNQALHNYLIKKNQASQIPKPFRHLYDL